MTLTDYITYHFTYYFTYHFKFSEPNKGYLSFFTWNGKVWEW